MERWANWLPPERARRGDEIGAVITSKEGLNVDQLAEKLRGHDVAIDFSIGEAVLKNIEACARAQVPLVEGTTGWKQHEASRETDRRRTLRRDGLRRKLLDRRESLLPHRANKRRRCSPPSTATRRSSKKLITIANATRLQARH